MSEEENRVAQYRPKPDGELWKIERLDDLCNDFGFSLEEAPRFHETASKYGTAWKILRLLYGISPLIVPLGSDAEYLRVWTETEIRENLKLDSEQFEIEVGLVKTVWARQRSAPRKPRKRLEPKAAKPAGEQPKPAAPKPAPKLMTQATEPLPKGAGFAIPAFEPPEMALALARHGFHDAIFLSGSESLEAAIEDRAFIAQLISHYASLLDEPMVTSKVRQAIAKELLINRFNREMMSQRVTTSRVQDLGETVKAIEASLRAQWDQINSICPYAKQASDRINFAGALSDVVDAMQELKGRKSNRKIDGLYTSYQIQVQMRDAVQHDMRYRCGQVAAIVEAMMPDALWNPSWRRAFTNFQCKQLDEGFRAGVKQLKENTNLALPDLESEGPGGEYPPLFVEPDEPPESVALCGVNSNGAVNDA